MDELVTKFQKCIDVYKTINDLELKKAYAIDIICYYEFFLKEHKAFGLFNMSFIDDLVKNLSNDSFFLNVSNSFYNNISEINYVFSKDEYLFIKKILKHIKITPIANNKIITDINILNKYLKNSRLAGNVSNTFKYYNSRMSNSYFLNLNNEKVVALSNKNILTLLHEVVHTRVNESKFDEFPSIFSEISLSSYYKLGDYFKRINDIKELQKTTLKKYKQLKNKYYLELLRYVYGLVLSIAFVNINGNNSKNIDKIIEITNNDSEMNVFELLKKLNINENDIINGMNNYKKILTKD